MKRITFLFVLLIGLTPSLALANHFGDFHVIPAASRGPGQSGSMWQTDVIIHNRGTTPLIFRITVQSV